MQHKADLHEILNEKHETILREASRTLVDNGTPLASIGIVDFKGWSIGDDPIGVVWAAVGKAALECPMAFARGTKGWLEHGAKRFGYEQVVAQMDASLPYLHRWAEFLGMSRVEYLTGAMRDGGDAWLYARWMIWD